MSVSETFEGKLKEQLENRITSIIQEKDGEQVEIKGSFIAIILPILIQLMSQWMDGCNDTPERAAKRVKRMGVWTRNNLIKGIRSEPVLNPVAMECNDSVKAVIEEATVEELTAINKEHAEESINWTPFGGVK